METLIQLLMGMSLAACAGLRAWMPLLLVGLLGRFGLVQLNHSFDILTQPNTLLVLGAATAIEVVGDKVIVVDHFLDAVGTLVRPMAGTILAASMFGQMDPQMSLLLGLIAGGGTALAVHTGKSAARVGATTLAPAHGGAGNAALSLLEDLFAFAGIWAAVLVPVLAFLTIALLMFLAYRLIRRARGKGVRLWQSLRGRNP